jgi:predicted MFS family arabinose efflux permease
VRGHGGRGEFRRSSGRLEADIRQEQTLTRPATAARDVQEERAPSQSALANPQYRLLFIGNVVTMLGFGMMFVVQGVLAFDLTGKNSSVGFVAMGLGLPLLFLGPVGGALSDRMSKRLLLILGQTAVGTAFFVIGLLAALDTITILVLAALTLVMGCCLALLMPARQAWVGDLLQGPALAHGVALQQLAMNGTRIVGPLAAGGMVSIAAIGVGGAYMVMGSLFLLSIILLVLMEPTHARRDRTGSVFGDLMVGLRYAWHTAEVRRLMLLFAGVVLSAFTYQQLMPGFLENELDEPASRVGVMFGATAVGGVVLAVILTRRAQGMNSQAMMFGFGVALAGSLGLLAVSPSFPLALCAAALVGASSSGFQMCNQVSLMQSTDAAYFGRVMSLTMTAFGLQMVVGFPAGVMADEAGERATLLLMAAVCLAIVVAVYASWRSGRRAAPAPAHRQA